MAKTRQQEKNRIIPGYKPLELPSGSLFCTPHEVGLKHKNLISSVFESEKYDQAIENMAKPYFHSKRYPEISFRPATTAESIFVMANNRSTILRSSCTLQMGYAVSAPKGIFFNPPLSDGKHITDVESLMGFLDRTSPFKVNRGLVYLREDEGDFLRDFSFVEYGAITSNSGDDIAISSVEFVTSGLAMGLEHKVLPDCLGKIAIRKPDYFGEKKPDNPYGRVWVGSHFKRGYFGCMNPILSIITFLEEGSGEIFISQQRSGDEDSGISIGILKEKVRKKR